MIRHYFKNSTNNSQYINQIARSSKSTTVNLSLADTNMAVERKT